MCRLLSLAGCLVFAACAHAEGSETSDGLLRSYQPLPVSGGPSAAEATADESVSNAVAPAAQPSEQPAAVAASDKYEDIEKYVDEYSHGDKPAPSAAPPAPEATPAVAAVAPAPQPASAPVAMGRDNAEDDTATKERCTEATREFATLSVRVLSKRANCTVRLNGLPLGKVPLRSVQVPAGEHRLMVSCGKRKRVETFVSLMPGGKQTVSLTAADFKVNKRRHLAQR